MFLSAILHMDLSKDDRYPPDNLSYSEIGANILFEQNFANEVSLRNVLAPILITLFRALAGMSSNLTYNLFRSSLSTATSVTNPSLTSPPIPPPSHKRPNPSTSSKSSPSKRVKVVDPKKERKVQVNPMHFFLLSQNKI